MPRYGKSPRDIRLRRRKRDDSRPDDLGEFEELSGEVVRESGTRSEKPEDIPDESEDEEDDDIEELAGEPFRESDERS